MQVPPGTPQLNLTVLQDLAHKTSKNLALILHLLHGKCPSCSPSYYSDALILAPFLQINSALALIEHQLKNRNFFPGA